MPNRIDLRGPVGRICMMSLLAALLVTGCGRGEDSAASLPPPTGEGAPPREKLPPLPAAGQGDTQAESSARTTTGTTYPRASAQIAPNASGVLAKVAVEEGDRVRKGDLLFRLRAQDFNLRVQQAQTALKSAEVGLSAVKVEYERTRRLFEKNAINQAAWDQIQATYQSTQVGVEQARVALAMAQKARADATVRSPINGVITAKLKSEGEMVTMMPPTVVVVVEDHSVLELRFRLPEKAISALAVGDTVKAQFASMGLERAAKVTRISPNVDMQTRTIEVIAEIPNQDGQLKAGMLAEIQVETSGDAAEPTGEPASAERGADEQAPAKPGSAKQDSAKPGAAEQGPDSDGTTAPGAEGAGEAAAP